MCFLFERSKSRESQKKCFCASAQKLTDVSLLDMVHVCAGLTRSWRRPGSCRGSRAGPAWFWVWSQASSSSEKRPPHNSLLEAEIKKCFKDYMNTRNKICSIIRECPGKIHN